ncbi:phosphate acyltransferase PlsX [Desulfosporosinus sp.]|uniref:phosphate acyltransferase PlsX n=1 Tax=Desulfosporosinus sp. TaxID=157907 RepID=UPI000E80B6F1|nr:phosphate acyltransferase PlsX [Desulfosporosinus sp.]MBC2721183.1 phosphate acyltransferase PlsX [Desulfosporosinus sp.]MBC2728221.1 phosphate acyltransferase PlsX [Desulfosporosinus sp.]HBV85820.1 phosphate acyltransferase PlsX [Desulfosporosinus sp.]
MRIAVDAMGGDYAPEEVLKGAMMAAEAWPDSHLILVGQKERLQTFLSGPLPKNVSLFQASEVIAMDEHPANAVRKKKDSSIVVATRLVKQGEADAIVSAGSTGAQMAAALLGLGRIKGIERPAIVTVLPTSEGGKLILDVGANMDATPAHLCQYAQMGSIYATKILGIPNPRVGLLNVGSEEGKGNELTQKAYPLLKEAPINFIGNVEGRDVPYGRADVVVCEGFAGNILLKTAEGLAGVLFEQIKEKITSNIVRKLGALAVKPGLKEIAQMMDYAEYGGAPLLGVNGISIICHGSSKSKAIFNAIRVARECVQVQLIEQIREDLPK